MRYLRGIMAVVKLMASLVLVGLLALVACSPGDRVDLAFEQLDGALPSQLRQVAEDDGASSRSARFEAEGEPSDVASLVRSSLTAKGFMLFPDSGLPDPAVAQPQPSASSGSNPVNLGSPPTTEPPAVDVIQISGFQLQRDRGVMRSLAFHPGPRPGWTVIVVTAAAQD